jgi:WD40 repeat protein
MGTTSGKIYIHRSGRPPTVLLEATKGQVEEIALYMRSGVPMPALIAGASRDGTIELVRPSTDDRFELHGHTAAVTHLAFSPDGERLLSSSVDGSVRLWRLRPQYDQTVFTDGINRRADFSPDGKRIAFATSGAVELQTVAEKDIDAKERSLPIGGGQVQRVAFSPDGKTVAAVQDGALQIVRADGTTRRLDSPKVLLDWIGWADGGERLIGVDSDGTAAVWEVASGRRVLLASGSPATAWAALAPDGDRVAVPTANRTLIFSARTPEQPLQIVDQTSEVVAAALDAERVALGNTQGQVEIVDLRSGARRTVRDALGYPVETLGFSPDGRELAVLDAGRNLDYIDVMSGRRTVGPRHTVRLHGARLSRDLSHAVAWAGTDVYVWDRESFAWRSLPGFAIDVRYATVSPDGNQAIVGCASHSAERIQIGHAPVPRDGVALRSWLDATTATVIDESGRPVTPR